MLWFRRLVLAAIALAVAAGVIVLARRAADFATLGDTAVIESYTWMATTGDLLLGPYSRFQWHHPGPISFFWIAPFYALSGARPAGLSAGAVALNLAVLAILTSTVIRRADTMLSVAIMAVATLYCWRIAPVFTSAWNPHLIVFAMMALIVAAADVLAGSYSRLPVVALLASVVGQTHVALMPSALAIGGISVLVAIVGSWRKGRRRSEIIRALLATIAVLALLWALPIAEQLADSPGNMTRLWRFFVSQSHPGQRFASAFSAWSDLLTGLVRPDFEVATGLRFRQSPIRWVEAFAVLELAGLAAAAALAARARRSFEASLSLVLLLISLLALWSTTRIEQTIFDHEVFWISGIGALNIALLLTLVVRLARGWQAGSVRAETDRANPAVEGRPLTWPVTVACLALFTACAGIGLREMFVTVAAASNPSPESDAVSTVAKELESYLDRERIVRPLVLIDQESWPLAAGVILRLQKDGVPVAVEDDWVPMFTPEFAATGRETAEIAIDGKAQHVRSLGKPGDVVIIEHDPQLFVHRILSR